MKFAERVKTVKRTEEFLKLNRIKDYEIIVLWEE